MILIIPNFREIIIKIVKYSNNIIKISNLLIIIVVILLILPYIGFLYYYIEDFLNNFAVLISNFLSFAVLTMLIIMDLPAYSFIWISIKQPQLGWLLLGFLIGGMLGIVLPVAVITQDGEIYPIEWVQGDDNN